MRALGLTLAIVFTSLSAAAQDEPPPPPPTTEEPPKAKPSVVIDAKDDLGHDLRAVTVFIDDHPVAYELGPQPIELEPGAHTIALQRNDGPRQRATATVTLAPGDTNHAVHLVFERPPEPEPVLAEPVNAPLAPRIVAAVGLAGVVTGVVLLLVRPSLPTNCDPDTGKCTRLAAQTDAQFAADRDDAGTNRALLGAGLATLLGGAAVTGAGVLWYVLEKPKPRTAMLAPWLQGSAGGVVLRASF